MYMWKPQGCHVMRSQVSVSYIKYMCLQYCATMRSNACIGHALGVCTAHVPEPYNIVYRAKHQNDQRYDGATAIGPSLNTPLLHHLFG